MQIKTVTDQVLSIPAASMANAQSGLAFPASVNTGQYLQGLNLEFQGRLTTATAAGAAVTPEAPWSLFRRVYVDIVHSIYGSVRLISLPGGTLKTRAYLFNRINPLSQGTTLATAEGAYDMDFVLPIVFPLEQVVQGQVANTLLDAPRCSSIKVSFDLGVGADLITSSGTTTYTWSAYGSNVGNPIVNLSRRIVNGFSQNPLTNLVMKSDRVDTLSNGVQPGSFNGQPLPVGANFIRLIGFKQYLPDVGSNDVPLSFLNPIAPGSPGLADPQVYINSSLIRDFTSWALLSHETQSRYNVAAPLGYGVVDFVSDGLAQDALNAQAIGQSRSVLNYGGLINASASGLIEVFLDQVMPNRLIQAKGK